MFFSSDNNDNRSKAQKIWAAKVRVEAARRELADAEAELEKVKSTRTAAEGAAESLTKQ